jgi:para-nitrobenzyl esterase
VLVGSNRDEQRLFLVPNGRIDKVDQALLRLAAYAYGAPVDRALAAYAAPGASPGETLAELATDWFYRIPAVRLAEAQTARDTPAWVYEFSWPSRRFAGRLGACHALEIGFVFDTVERDAELTGPGAPPALAAEMHGAWVRFIRDGDPGWDPYEPGRRPVRDFGEQVRLVHDPRPERRALWDGVR